MAFSINREIGINPQSKLFAPNPSDFIRGDELSKVARDLLSTSSVRTSVNTPDVKIFTQGADVVTVRQVATNMTGYDVSISQDAMSAINALKAQAAQNQVQNLSRVVDGKIHINSEKVDASEVKSIFNNSGNNGIQVSESANTNKDRRSSGGFFIPFEMEEEGESQEGINLVI